MEDHITHNESAPLTWTNARSAKDRSAVERGVMALLNTLAPEQTLTRAERQRERIERHRTPTGCVLQGPPAAVSVSWFADASTGAGFGELHVIVWNGIVARRGVQAQRGAATVVSSFILRPDASDPASGVWLDADDVVHATPQVAERIMTLLEQQLGA